MIGEVKSVPSISVSYARTGNSTKANALGMRPMQERAYEKRGEQYLLIKSPPASGKSRALMFIALDKLLNQGLKQAIIVVPEKAIGASFQDEPLTKFGFWADWRVEPKWNLCNAPGGDNGGKVKSVGAFLESGDKVLVCTHATFRFAVDEYGIEKFDDRLIAVDEFHHVSANPDNKLGLHLGQFIARNRVHVVAMTGSYFRGDAEAVLAPQDEAKFDSVTYTYYEQLNGYEYLKQLDIGYFFYSGSYVDDILNVLNPDEKTIIHIPNVNSRESTKDKIREVEQIIGELGEWQGIEAVTGFQLVKTKEGRLLRIADLVDDDPNKRDRVSAALKDPAQKNHRDYVDIIIALGMAKEGFDWIWCDHALTVGYRASLTEIVQIIGRATRDAPGKTRARFTNLIAEPDASEQAVSEAVNDTLKAIAASLLMEQVLAPRFEFRPKRQENSPTPGYDYGESGYDPGKCNVGFNEQTGTTLAPDKFLNKAGYPSRGLQDPATVSWNFATGLYYKTQPEPPWKLAHVRPGVCYIGLVFKMIPNDPKEHACCAAQMFLNEGDAMVFRGANGPWKTGDFDFHLKALEAKKLISKVLDTFKDKHGQPPKEFFIHGRTTFNDEEWDAFKEVAPAGTNVVGVRIKTTRGESKLFRDGDYPVMRGTAILLDDRNALLWTNGFAPRLDTYIGPETPNPLSITVLRSTGERPSIRTVLSDIMGLTKINYNACNYNDGLPVTIRFANKVGDVLTMGSARDAEKQPLKFYV